MRPALLPAIHQELINTGWQTCSGCRVHDQGRACSKHPEQSQLTGDTPSLFELPKNAQGSQEDSLLHLEMRTGDYEKEKVHSSDQGWGGGPGPGCRQTVFPTDLGSASPGLIQHYNVVEYKRTTPAPAYSTKAAWDGCAHETARENRAEHHRRLQGVTAAHSGQAAPEQFPLQRDGEDQGDRTTELEPSEELHFLIQGQMWGLQQPPKSGRAAGCFKNTLFFRKYSVQYSMLCSPQASHPTLPGHPGSCSQHPNVVKATSAHSPASREGQGAQPRCFQHLESAGGKAGSS